MSRARFGALLAALGVVVAVGAFAAARSVLDDGRPDPPPPSSVDSGDTLGSDPVVTPSSTSTTVPGALVTPAWVAVVASEGDEAGATTAADALTAAGYAAGVLHSDDYPSLAKGLWVAYAGPYPDHGAADAAVATLAADGFGGAYARCVGTAQECGTEDD